MSAGKILIAEDNEDVAWLAAFHLRDVGYHVITVTADWRTLFDVGTWLDVDVAVVDLHLKADTNGVHVLRWLAEYLPGIRRVMFTASISDNDDDVYVEAVTLCDAFVSKLDVADALIEAVRR